MIRKGTKVRFIGDHGKALPTGVFGKVIEVQWKHTGTNNKPLKERGKVFRVAWCYNLFGHDPLTGWVNENEVERLRQ